MPQRFGEKLRALRVHNHLTQAQLAQQLGLATQSHLSYLETGKSAPSIALVMRVAIELEVSSDYLLRDTMPTHPLQFRTRGTQSDLDIARSFGEQIRHLRVQRGLSQVQLAEHLHPLSQAYISFLETGQKAPSVDIVLRCADVFGVSVDDLLQASGTNRTEV